EADHPPRRSPPAGDALKLLQIPNPGASASPASGLLRVHRGARPFHTVTYVRVGCFFSHSIALMRASTFRRLFNLWPPALVNAIRVQSLSEDYTEATVVLRLRPWNRNYVKSQFGGNLFAMVDPFWMLLAMHQLGS